MATTVVIRQLTSGTESARILDALDSAVDSPSDKLSNGRRYSIDDVTNRVAAVAYLEAHLDRISTTWPSHVTIHGID
ncbi:MAG: hypothetical protein QOF37_322 [Thermoleophilaceae bacterium]|nr:hypothetical protein [Thermoleophilaceae bacterium]